MVTPHDSWVFVLNCTMSAPRPEPATRTATSTKVRFDPHDRVLIVSYPAKANPNLCDRGWPTCPRLLSPLEGLATELSVTSGITASAIFSVHSLRRCRRGLHTLACD